MYYAEVLDKISPWRKGDKDRPKAQGAALSSRDSEIAHTIPMNLCSPPLRVLEVGKDRRDGYTNSNPEPRSPLYADPWPVWT